jgi:uncharacterized protein YmfQ (DUF2313 family)
MADIPAGWPCATLPAVPPSVRDKQAYPTADEILPQVLALAPRGPAWGTDEAGDGAGASPVQLGFWRGLAAWVADLNTREFDLATQALPSAITWSLPDWERDYGLPDTCSSGQGGTPARVAAVRARFGALGGQSPAYFVCLAQSLGYDISIEEPTQFLIDTSEVGEGLQETWFLLDESEIGPDGHELEGFVMPGEAEGLDAVVPGSAEAWFLIDDGEVGPDGTPLESIETDDPRNTVWKFWVVKVASLGETWFRTDEGVIEEDPLEGFLPASDLECMLRRNAPQHTTLLFDYGA